MKRKNYNTKKIRTFLAFLFLACVIWVLTKFSKEYTATVSGKINYTSIPVNSELGEGNPESISFDITANGFQFLLYQIKMPEVNVSVSQFYSEEKKSADVGREDLSRIVMSSLDKAINIKDLSPSQLHINLEEIDSRKFPVFPKASVSYKDGFRKVRDIILKPDSVTVLGAKSLLDSFTHFNTEEIVVENLDNVFQTKVKIDKPDGVKITIEPSVVDLTIDVAEFTQKSITVPIRLINVPSNISIRIIPETLSVTFDVSVANFNVITANDFAAVCDFSEKNSEENFMLVKITKQPDYIQNMEIEDKRIDYLIFK